MIEAWGTVASIDGDHVQVRMEAGGCGRCLEPGGCGGTNLSQMFCATPREYRVHAVPDLSVGQRVCIVVSDGAVSHTATRLYGLPLAALLGGALLGGALAGEGGAMAVAALGLIAAFGWLRWRSARSGRNDHFAPHIKA